MSLDTTKPTDQVLVSEIPSYIRENRSSINAFEDVEGEIVETSIDIAAGVITLDVPTNLSLGKVEIIKIDAPVAVYISTITGGNDGQIKIFVFQSDNVYFTDGLKSGGQFYLNQLPVGQNFNGHEDDVLALINVGGGATSDGYWKELYRTLNVK